MNSTALRNSKDFRTLSVPIVPRVKQLSLASVWKQASWTPWPMKSCQHPPEGSREDAEDIGEVCCSLSSLSSLLSQLFLHVLLPLRWQGFSSIRSGRVQLQMKVEFRLFLAAHTLL